MLLLKSTKTTKNNKMTTTFKTEMTTFTGEDRQEMTNQIRTLFIKWNQGVEPSEYIEKLWAKMSQENLQLALENFTRLDESSKKFEVELPLSYDHREELIVTLSEIQVQSMDLESLKLFFLERQIECYEDNYTDAQLLSELKDCVGEDEFTEILEGLGN